MSSLARLVERVQRQRVIDAAVHRERHVGVEAVHRAGRREYQVLCAIVAATFEHVERASDIAVDVGLRILERVTHAGLRGEVDDAREFFAREQRFHAALVGEVHLHEAELRFALEDGEPRALEVRVVVVVEVVEPTTSSPRASSFRAV